MSDSARYPEPLAKALSRVEQEILAGLRHGHFKMDIECEMITGEKRRIIIDAGKKHKFIIAENEIPGA